MTEQLNWTDYVKSTNHFKENWQPHDAETPNLPTWCILTFIYILYSLVFLSNIFRVDFFLIKWIPMYQMYFLYFYTGIFINWLCYFNKWWVLIFCSSLGENVYCWWCQLGGQLWPSGLTSGPQTSPTCQLSACPPLPTAQGSFLAVTFLSLFLWVWVI